MTIPKRPPITIPTMPSNMTPPGIPGASGPAGPAGASRPPPSSGTTAKPVTIRDAMAEAHAIAGGALGRTSTAPSAFAPVGKKSILLVDDDAAHRERLKAALAPLYLVVEAKDGMEAVDMIGNLTPVPSMVVTGVKMPRVDGFTLAKILRGNPIMKKVPILFVSATNSPQEVTQALVLGACQFVPKSTAPSDIVAKIRKIVV